MWWCTPVIPGLCRWRQGAPGVQSQPQLSSMPESISLGHMRPISKQLVHIYLYVWYKIFVRCMVCSFYSDLLFHLFWWLLLILIYQFCFLWLVFKNFYDIFPITGLEDMLLCFSPILFRWLFISKLRSTILLIFFFFGYKLG